MSRILGALLLLLILPGLVWAATAADLLQARALSPRVINVSGQLDKEGWLGLTVYATNPSTPPYNFLQPAKAGRLSQALYVDPVYAGGTFEVAIWDKKVPRPQCVVPKCLWCPKSGYHLATMRAYAKGALPR